MLKGVVHHGTAKNIRARGFEIAGKTGTSKIAQGSKGYGDKYQASFCGFFPADDPLYSCIVVIQGPTKDIYGAKVSGTVFKEIADKVYAQEFEKKQNEMEVDQFNYPPSKDGSKEDFLIVFPFINLRTLRRFLIISKKFEIFLIIFVPLDGHLKCNYVKVIYDFKLIFFKMCLEVIT